MIYLNEGLNDRYYGYYQQRSNIVTDIKLDELLSRTPPEKIWFGSDWHLYKWNKETEKIEKNKDFDKLIYLQNKYVKDDDVFIFLGDLVDDECQNYEELKENLKGKLNGYCVMILGNNDLQPESYYHELGFTNSFFAYQWGKFTFSHEPLKKYNSNYNIHGHMHEWWDYTYQGTPWNNMIKIYTYEYNLKPINLREIVNRYNKGYYTKNIK